MQFDYSAKGDNITIQVGEPYSQKGSSLPKSENGRMVMWSVTDGNTLTSYVIDGKYCFILSDILDLLG